MRLRISIVAGAVAAAAAWPAGQSPAGGRFAQRDEMIAARDGVRLHVALYTPTDARGPLPILLVRTPYGVANAPARFDNAFKELADDGYIFAFADIRGRYQSEGQFVMQRPLCAAKDAKCVDEGTDAYDTIDWLVKHVPGHNGRVGMLGVSYDGWLTIMAAVRPHPALKAVSPQASPADMWLGDDFHHNGAFRLSYGFEYAARMERSKEQTPFEFERYDTFQWYQALGPLANINAKYVHGTLPTWNDFVEHPDYDDFWKKQAVWRQLGAPQVPTLDVAGWWDQEDFYGPNKIYETLEAHDSRHLNFLVVGPWNHGGWNAADGGKLGPIDFGSPASRDFRRNIQAPWFAHFLKDAGTTALPKAVTFEAGANQWRKWDEWPPKSGMAERSLYMASNGALAFDPPVETAPDAADEYVSDPAHPVPYRHPPIPPTYLPGGSGWTTWLVEDQRFLDGRPDVLVWQTEPLAGDVAFAGRVTAHLFASTSGTDSDWIVKLIDVYPESVPGDVKMSGYQLMVSNEVLRGRYRTSGERPEPVPANAVVGYDIDLHTQNYRFKKAHRIMVQVQSTWFPLIDRNPQTFVPNIFKASAGDFRAAIQRVYRSVQYPSRVTIAALRE
jgi:putative CocE/NonD family hydrolase